MEGSEKKTYLFIKDTCFKNGNLTGAHRRFLELVKDLSRTENIILITREIPQLDDIDAKRYLIGEKKTNGLPEHINGMIDICKVLCKVKEKIKYDYAISFGPSNTICYKICGYKNVVSLFREDLIGYQKAIGASALKIQYSRWQECMAVRASDKIIVQCENDKKNLIERNRKYCKDIAKKVYIQINNANASWMKTEKITHQKIDDGKTRILFIGGFSDKRKGHSILFPAVARLIDEGFNVELLIAGDGKELGDYKKQFEKYEGFRFLGRVDNLSYYLSISDFEVVPSLIDSCPNTVLEGLNAGITVYGANTGGIPDLLGDEEYLFEPSSEKLYVFLKRVLESQCYIKEAAVQRKCKEKLTFDWSKKIQAVIECKRE